MSFLVTSQAPEMIALGEALGINLDRITKITIEFQAHELAKVIIERRLTTGELREIIKII